METSRYSNNDHSSYAIMPGCFNKSEPSLLQRRDEGLIRKDRIAKARYIEYRKKTFYLHYQSLLASRYIM
jgi:hypothetical protein